MEDERLLRNFEDCTLPFEQWTHRAHIKVAYLYLTKCSFDQALRRMRASIKRYNAANNIPQTPQSGYNETITQAFLRLVHATIEAFGGDYPTADADEFCDTHPHLLEKYVLRLFYSKSHWDRSPTQEVFVEPDLATLPPVGGRKKRDNLHMLHHVSLAVFDISVATEFYDAALAPLGYRRVYTADDFVGYGTEDEKDKFAIACSSSQVIPPETGFHLAFSAPNRRAVDSFHRAALQGGGIDNGGPGLREHYGPHYYAAFVIDPDGYHIEAVINGS